MDKKDWQDSLKSLEDVKKQKERDLEEINFAIECYKNKVESFGE
jgi:hypothetical protein